MSPFFRPKSRFKDGPLLPHPPLPAPPLPWWVVGLIALACGVIGVWLWQGVCVVLTLAGWQ